MAGLVEVCNLWPRKSKTGVYYGHAIVLWGITRVLAVGILLLYLLPIRDHKGTGLLIMLWLVWLRFCGHLGVMCHTHNASPGARAMPPCGQWRRLRDGSREATMRSDHPDTAHDGEAGEPAREAEGCCGEVPEDGDHEQCCGGKKVV